MLLMILYAPLMLLIAAAAMIRRVSDAMRAMFMLLLRCAAILRAY